MIAKVRIKIIENKELLRELEANLIKKIFEMDLRNVVKQEAEIRFLSLTKNNKEYDIKRIK